MDQPELMIGDQASNDLPAWFQLFLKHQGNQMNEIMQRINVIDQRMQPTPLSTTPGAATPTPVTPSPSPAPAPPEPKRPKPKLPDVPIFTGKRSKWRAWKSKMIAKLAKDGRSIGDASDQFAYIEARLEGDATEMVLAFIEKARRDNNEDPNSFMAYLDVVYGDKNASERASNKLNTMAQGKRAFVTFLPKFERTLAEAGGSEWSDHVKIHTLKRMLNHDLKRQLISIHDHPSKYTDFVEVVNTMASRLAALDCEAQGTTTTTYTGDTMDWESSTNRVQVNGQERKRAKWVPQEVMEKRKAEHRCLRCGEKGHFIGNCKLLPAKPPHYPEPAKTKVMEAKVAETSDAATVTDESHSESEKA